jgi:DsbC/DsbD-like thiol-disulfide interchange protein
MITLSDRLRRAAAPGAIGLCAVWFVTASHAAAAEDASRWDGDARNAMRLIAGSSARGGGASLRAGIEIRLAPGWHTYWRYPGDAGVPPRFDFAGSQNVKAVDVHWPVPQRLPEEAVTVIGYTGNVILPLTIVPENRAKPVMLRLKLDYAVCEKLCIPAEGKAELMLGGGPSSQDAALLTAEARVPKKVALGEGSTLAITSVRREDGGTRPRVVVDVAAPAGEAVALFAEGPTPEWALPVPVPAPVAGAGAGMQRFAFELDGAPPGQGYDRIAITLTASAGNSAIEVATRLD